MPTNPQHTPTIIQPSTSQPQKKQRSRRPNRKDTEVPQPSRPTDNVEDEAVYEERDDSLERAATIATGLDAEQDRGDGPRHQDTMGDTIAQTRSKNVSKQSNDPLLAREHKDCSSLGDYKSKTKSQEEDASKQGRKINDIDKETTELQRLIEVVPDKEEVAVDAIPLAIKPPSIVDWKIYKKGKKSYCQIIRADGSLKMYLVFGHMLKSFDREDLETLYKLVKAKYGSTRPVEDLDLVLYGDLKTIFDPHVEDQVWKNQSDYRVLEWKLYDSCGVHSLRKQKVHIHMLVEKRYHLTSPTITDMLNKKLKADHWNEMCYQLLKLITK
ncbi:hypothetical protein Tco_0267771 [Tanacetum coccineum]